MNSLHLHSYGLAPFQAPTTKNLRPARHVISSGPTKLKISAISTARREYIGGQGARRTAVCPPRICSCKKTASPTDVNFHSLSVLLPDGTPDVHFRNAPGAQKLRDIMLDTNIELYGPYSRALLNCGGGGTCATCMVEVIEGKELLSPRTDNEKEKLKKKPKNWRLACQTTVGDQDSRGLVVIQQLPEWKAHEWNYEKLLPSEMLSEIQSD
ncbi:hypothetical protein OIU84_023001 [Salix udensis]|uniref:2Fe-2S ferredoxin-type domain-containing protein n=1 Tax=Salix udensis TaxID=889485 RepID=A0AAD6KRB4_9ROSI|nr:hypothetical protein OIU84_023001 [Salix udensis]